MLSVDLERVDIGFVSLRELQIIIAGVSVLPKSADVVDLLHSLRSLEPLVDVEALMLRDWPALIDGE